MRSHWWRPLTIVLALLALVTAMLTHTRNPDLVLRERLLDAIRNYELSDAEMARDVLAARAGLQANYDPLATDRRNLVRALGVVEKESAAGSWKAQSFLAPHIGRLKRLPSRKADVGRTLQVQECPVAELAQVRDIGRTRFAHAKGTEIPEC